MRSSPQTKLRNCKLYHLRLNCFSEQVSNILASWNIDRTNQRLATSKLWQGFVIHFSLGDQETVIYK